MKKINLITKEVLEKVEPSKKDLEIIKNSLKEFKQRFEAEIKKAKLNVKIFVGGSFAKKTIIKKDIYDVDIFLKFDKKYKDISKITEKLLKNFKNVIKIHGSRDYFKIKKSPNFFIELIPTRKVKNMKDFENITDLSFFHVKYINKKVENKKILNDIKIAKAFCYANNCYGAESYIQGFSGYSLELLIYYYQNFLKFIKEISKHKKDKIIIDIEKYYKNKNNVLLDMNSSKLESPIILVDPTFKQRNVLAALSEETFKKFKKACKEFLKNPSIKSFEIKKIDLEKVKKQALKKKYEFILLEVKTQKQEGDIAGTKLLKFYKHLEKEIQRFFEIKNKGFNYNHKKSARFFFVVKKKKEIILQGPFVKDEKNSKKFKKQHKNIFIKSGKIYAKEKINFNLKKFIENWKKKYKKKLKDMYINKLEII
jgi:tRNA nucleotidyltransferase (CCA-adding enzyme)